MGMLGQGDGETKRPHRFSRSPRRPLGVMLIFLCAPGLFAQTYRPGPQVVTFFSNVDDTDQPYSLYLPPHFDTAKKYPLVISLHGGGSNHRLNLRRVFGQGNRPGEADSEASRYFPPLPQLNYIVASPLARGTMGYQGIAEKDVYDVLADVKSRFPIDENRIYLTGLSMGGGGALWLGLTRPDIWAAISAVCPAPPAGTEDLAPNALNLPVHLFHGEQDPIVPVDVSRHWHRNLLDLGTKVEYVEYPGVRHNAWDKAYRKAAIFDWFTQFERMRFPERVRFVSRAYKYDSAYWVHLDALTPGVPATLDARFAARNRVEIVTQNVEGFTLQIIGHPQFSSTGLIQTIIDGAIIKQKARDTLSFRKTEKGWRAGRYAALPGSKRPGSEGPIAEAISSRHIYVYGTLNSSGEEELKTRKESAAYAAEWSPGAPGRLLLSFAVKADQDVNEGEMLNSNLVLFGSKETNSIIARLSERLPMALNASAADYGLVFIAPLGNRYVLVNSGLNWWVGADRVTRAGLRRSRSLPPAYQVLMTFGDYILFKGSLENVVAEGRFDGQWKLPAVEAAKVRETGAVVIQ